MKPEEGQNRRRYGNVAEEGVSSRDPADGLRGMMPKSHPQERKQVVSESIKGIVTTALSLQLGFAV